MGELNQNIQMGFCCPGQRGRNPVRSCSQVPAFNLPCYFLRQFNTTIQYGNPLAFLHIALQLQYALTGDCISLHIGWLILWKLISWCPCKNALCKNPSSLSVHHSPSSKSVNQALPPHCTSSLLRYQMWYVITKGDVCIWTDRYVQIILACKAWLCDQQ